MSPFTVSRAKSLPRNLTYSNSSSEQWPRFTLSHLPGEAWAKRSPLPSRRHYAQPKLQDILKLGLTSDHEVKAAWHWDDLVGPMMSNVIPWYPLVSSNMASWKIPELNGDFNGKITDQLINGLFSSTPCLMTPEGTHLLVFFRERRPTLQDWCVPIRSNRV